MRNLHGKAANIGTVKAPAIIKLRLFSLILLIKANIEIGYTKPRITTMLALIEIGTASPVSEAARATNECHPVG
ncbi:hypothetical protein MCC01992_11100 [Bifidobacteriaceae bacterium MCC01992]|nr:hypothetical protein MCC01992_11100 [Bifidobacteriaceae bacterium MCC01992]